MDGTIKRLARLRIIPTVGMLVLFIWGLLGDGLLDAIRFAATQSLPCALFDFAGFGFLLVSVPAFWVLSSAPKPQPLYSQRGDRLT